MKIEITEDQIKEIIYDARYYPNKSYKDLIEQFQSKPSEKFPTINGSVDELIIEYPNHSILIEIDENSDLTFILYKYISKHGEVKYFEKFKIYSKRIYRVPAGIPDMHNREYHGVNHIIEYPNAFGIWVRNDA